MQTYMYMYIIKQMNKKVDFFIIREYMYWLIS